MRVSCKSPQGVPDTDITAVRYEWHLDGLRMLGVTQRRLELPQAMLWHSGRYSCHLKYTDIHNRPQIASGSMLLRVLRRSEFDVYESQLKPHIHTVQRSGEIVQNGSFFSAACLAVRAQRITWFVNGTAVDVRPHSLTNARLLQSGSANLALSINPVSLADSGAYTCMVRNQYGVDMQGFVLRVNSTNGE